MTNLLVQALIGFSHLHHLLIGTGLYMSGSLNPNFAVVTIFCYREDLRRPAPKPRIVPAFSIQSYQRGVVVERPPKPKEQPGRPTTSTSFKRFYIRGDFPISMESSSIGHKIAWKVWFSIYILI